MKKKKRDPRLDAIFISILAISVGIAVWNGGTPLHIIGDIAGRFITYSVFFIIVDQTTSKSLEDVSREEEWNEKAKHAYVFKVIKHAFCWCAFIAFAVLLVKTKAGDSEYMGVILGALYKV